MSISTNEYTGKHASRRGNSILIVLILFIKNIFIVDAKVKELVYSGNTVFFLLPSREHDLQFMNAGRGCKMRPYRRDILQSQPHNYLHCR